MTSSDWKVVPPAPHERNILGTVMLYPTEPLIEELEIRAEDFIDERHSYLWQLLVTRHREGLPIDTVSIVDNLAKDGALERYGGALYISNHANGGEVCIPAYLPTCVREVKARAQERRIVYATQGAALAMQEPNASRQVIAEKLQAALKADREEVARTLSSGLDAWLDAKVDEAEGTTRPYLDTGIRGWDWNQDFVGLSRQGVTLILGASGSGKTSLLNRLALGIKSKGASVYLHGTETAYGRRLDDMMQSLAQVNGQEWGAYAQKMTPGQPPAAEVREDQHRLMSAFERAAAWHHNTPGEIHITGGSLTVEEICYRARALHRRHGIECVIVDYLQDIADSRGEGLRIAERTQQVMHKSTALKELACDLGIPVVVGAQVSGEKQGPGADPRPKMWDCQWSSTAHQDAEEVYAIYRDDYYRASQKAWTPLGNPGVIEVIARKRRRGRLGTMELAFDGPTKWVGEAIDLDAADVIPLRRDKVVG